MPSDFLLHFHQWNSQKTQMQLKLRSSHTGFLFLFHSDPKGILVLDDTTDFSFVKEICRKSFYIYKFNDNVLRSLGYDILTC